jgi:GDPmannose 4,6-dehydratase
VVKSFENPILTFNTNVEGSLNLISCVEKYQKECKFHFCSTSEVYGDICKDIGVLREDSSIQPINPYAVSKAAIDLYVQERIRNGFIKGFITRAFSHTGPRRGHNFSISSDAYQIAKMVLGMQEKVLLIGNLETQRVVMDVEDCVRAYYQLMIGENSYVEYNVCGVGVHKMQFFTDLLIAAANLENVEQRIHPPFYRPIDIQLQIGDIGRLTKDTNWQQEVLLNATMKNLLNYWINKLGSKKE